MLEKYKEYGERKAKEKKELLIEELKGMKIKPPLQYGDLFIPPKPPKVSGYLFKLGSMFGGKNKRFFVLNPRESKFAKYINEAGYPEKPRDIYSIELLQALKMKRPAPKQQFYFFEVRLARLTRCCSSTISERTRSAASRRRPPTSG